MSGILALGSRICNQTPTLTAQTCAAPSSQRIALLVAAGVITFTYLSASFAIHRLQNRPIKDLTGAKLYEAAEHGNLALVKRYLAGKTNVNSKEGLGSSKTPLMAAAANGHKGVVQALLDAGADANINDTDQRTALHHAAAGGQASVVALLFSKSSEDAKRSPDKKGDAPAHLAAQAGSILCLNSLVVPRPKTNENTLSQNIQHLLAIQGIEYFRGSESLLGETDNKKNLPLHYVAQKANKEVALRYLRETKNPNERNAEGLSPLHVAIKNSRNSDKVIAFIKSDRFDLAFPTSESSPKTSLQLAQESGLQKKDRIVRLINTKLAMQQARNLLAVAVPAVAVPVAVPVVNASASAASSAPRSERESPAGELLRTIREDGAKAGLDLFGRRIKDLVDAVKDPQRSVLDVLRRQQGSPQNISWAETEQ